MSVGEQLVGEFSEVGVGVLGPTPISGGTATPRQRALVAALALAAAGFLAFLPEAAFIGGSANNDNAAALFGTLALLGGMLIFQDDDHTNSIKPKTKQQESR